MEAAVSTVLVNILLATFILVVLSWVLVGVQTFIDERKRDKREAAAEIRAQEAAKRDAEYHLERMKEIRK